MTFWQQFPIVIHALNEGALQTLKLFLVTLVGAIPLGLLICMAGINRKKIPFALGVLHLQFWQTTCLQVLKVISRTLVWIVRGTPLMIQLLVIYYFPGLVLKQNVWGTGEAGRFTAASIAFILNYACYFSQIFRGGIQSIPVGQDEAGLVLGLTKMQIFFRIKLLQMVKRIVPPMANEIITLVKDTSLARIIALQEIIWAGQAFMKGKSGISGAIWPLFFTAVYYLAMNGLLTFMFGWLERKLDYFR